MFITTNESGARPLSGLTRVAFADGTERLLVLVVYFCLVWRLLTPLIYEGQFANIFLLTSEGLVVAFLLVRRRATNISSNGLAWAVALFATLTPMLVNPSDGPGLMPPLVGAGLMLMGMVIQVHAKVVLGRSFGCVPAHRGLKLAGPYRFVRHPMYAGYLLSHVAFLLMNPTLRNTVVYAITYSLQFFRILEEEEFLSSDPQYRQYRSVVRSRLIPGIF